MATYNSIGSMNLERGFPYGSHTWKPPMDRNLKKLAYIIGGSVKSRTAIPPEDAPVGDMYISPPGHAHADSILISNGGDDWDVVTPRNGLTFLVEDTSSIAVMTSNAWTTAFELNAPPPNDHLVISSFHPGEPGDGYFFLRRVTSGPERILAAGPHSAYTNVVSNGTADLVIAKNGTTIGTVTFTSGENEGTVVIPSDVVFNQGDILTIRTGFANGIEDFCVTLDGRREYNVT